MTWGTPPDLAYPEPWHGLVRRVQQRSLLLRPDPGDETWTHQRAHLTGLPFLTVAALDHAGFWLPFLRDVGETAFEVHVWRPPSAGSTLAVCEVVAFAFGVGVVGGWWFEAALGTVLASFLAAALHVPVRNASRRLYGALPFHIDDLRGSFGLIHNHEEQLGSAREPILGLRSLALTLKRREPVLAELRRAEHRAMGGDPTLAEDLAAATLVAAGKDDGRPAGALTDTWRQALAPSEARGEAAANPWWERKIFA